MLLRVTAPWFTAGVEIRNGLVWNAAPIIAYMVNNKWTLEKLQSYVTARGWEIENIECKGEGPETSSVGEGCTDRVQPGIEE